MNKEFIGRWCIAGETRYDPAIASDKCADESLTIKADGYEGSVQDWFKYTCRAITIKTQFDPALKEHLRSGLPLHSSGIISEIKALCKSGPKLTWHEQTTFSDSKGQLYRETQTDKKNLFRE